MEGVLRSRKFVLASILLAFAAASSLGFSRGSLPEIDPSLAACAMQAPTLEAEPKQVSQGGSFEVRGEGFGELVECDDTGRDTGSRVEPLEDISIQLRQDERKWELSTVDADRDLAFDEELQLPAGVAPGRATVTAEGNPGTIKTSIAVSGEGDLPDTGGLPLLPLACGLFLLAVSGGMLLVKRRLS